MAVEKIEINEPVEGEEMSLEQQLEQQEAENPSLVEQEQQTTQQEPSGQEDEEKPDWLPSKFKSPEELAKAYAQLEKERGQESEPKTEEKAEATQPNLTQAIEEASDAFFRDGEISEDNIKALEDNGIPREFVDAYVKGQQATLDAEAESIRSTVGGQDNYDAMADWANENLSEEEIDTFDSLVTTGSSKAAEMAVKGLYARYLSETGGQGVNIAKGSTSGAGIQPFNSNAQVVEAMNDKRFESDPAYRAEVERRISVSTNI
jgi:hypothetical protein